VTEEVIERASSTEEGDTEPANTKSLAQKHEA